MKFLFRKRAAERGVPHRGRLQKAWHHPRCHTHSVRSPSGHWGQEVCEGRTNGYIQLRLLQVWYGASDFHPRQRAENNRTGGRLTWWCNHWRWHLDFNHKLIASAKQLKIYSQGKKRNGRRQVRRLCSCVPAKEKGTFLNRHERFQDKYYCPLMCHDAHVAKWAIWDSPELETVIISPERNKIKENNIYFML